MVDSKVFLLLLIAFVFAFEAKSQAPYSGGCGDGYASATWSSFPVGEKEILVPESQLCGKAIDFQSFIPYCLKADLNAASDFRWFDTNGRELKPGSELQAGTFPAGVYKLAFRRQGSRSFCLLTLIKTE